MIVLPPLNTVEHGWHLYHVLITAVGSYGFTRIYNTIVKAMPPLPTNANFWEKWGYAIMQGLADTTPQGASKP